jgi:hypothetical protein
MGFEAPLAGPGDQLHAVADAEDRSVERQPACIKRWRVIAKDRGGSSREDQPDQARRTSGRRRIRAGADLTVDALLADATGDELSVLRAKVQNQDKIMAIHGALQRLSTNTAVVV